MAVIYSRAKKPARASVTVREKTRKAEGGGDAPAPGEKKPKKEKKEKKDGK